MEHNFINSHIHNLVGLKLQIDVWMFRLWETVLKLKVINKVLLMDRNSIFGDSYWSLILVWYSVKYSFTEKPS